MIKVLLRRGDVEKATGLKRSSLYKQIKDGGFPRPIKLNENGRAVGWLEEEVAAWQAARIAARDAEAA